MADHRAGLCTKPPIRERMAKALDFTVGGDINAVIAKDTLRALSVTL